MNAKYMELEAAIERSKCYVLSDKETAELKKLYYRVIRQLHPDLHPDLLPGEKILFYKAVDAYQNGDLTELRLINEAVADPKDVTERDSLSQMKKDKEFLQSLFGSLKKEIEEIKGRFPYSVRRQLENEEWVAAKRADLEQNIKEYRELCRKYTERIRTLLG